MPTYNIVEQGAANDGSSYIDPTLNDLVGDNNTIFFPKGDYLLESASVPSGTTNVTFQGEPGANIIPHDWGSSDPTAPLIDAQGNGFEMHQFNFQVNGRNPGPVKPIADNWELTRLATIGETHCATDGEAPGDSSVARTWFRPVVESSGATGLIEDCYFADGSNQSVSAGSNRRAILVERGSGDLTINRCWFWGWGENTIYAKQPAGAVNVYNTYAKNTQNGFRTGGNTEVWNTVIVQNARCPPNWADSQLQPGIVYEAETSASGTDIDAWSGTHTIRECDVRVDAVPSSAPQYPSTPFGGSSAPQNAEIINSRAYYRSNRSDHAVESGLSSDGSFDSWTLDGLHVTHDGTVDQYHVYVGETPGSWGTTSGVLGGSNTTYSNSTQITNNMTTGGNATLPNTTPPMPSPPSGSTQAMGNAQWVEVDNSGQSTSSTYSFDASGTVHPSKRGSSTINMSWASDGTAGRRIQSASGTVAAGNIHAYYVYEGTVDTSTFSQDGSATLTTDDTDVDMGPQGKTYQNGAWQVIDDGDVKAESSLAAATLKYYDGSQWVVVVQPN